MLNSLNDIVCILFVAKRDNAHTLHVTVIKKALNFEYPVGLPLIKCVLHFFKNSLVWADLSILAMPIWHAFCELFSCLIVAFSFYKKERNSNSSVSEIC